MFGTMTYIVASIDGDYAHLQRTDEADSELKLVARALLPDGIAEGTKCEISEKVGEAIAKKATKAKIKQVVFDRGGYLYHGRVKALAEAARENGLEF